MNSNNKPHAKYPNDMKSPNQPQPSTTTRPALVSVSAEPAAAPDAPEADGNVKTPGTITPVSVPEVPAAPAVNGQTPA